MDGQGIWLFFLHDVTIVIDRMGETETRQARVVDMNTLGCLIEPSGEVTVKEFVPWSKIGRITQ